MKKIVFIFVILSLLTAASPAVAQTDKSAKDEILAAGNPPLTRKQLNDLLEYFEWSLKARFTAGQQSRIEQIVVAEWRAASRDTAQNFALLFDKVRRFKALSASRRDEVQPRQQASYIEFITREPRSELDQILYDAYRQARVKDADADDLADGDASNERKNLEPSGGKTDLVGEWSTGEQAFSLFGSSAGNVFANAGGSLRSFKIYPDGRVEFAAFFTQSLSSCVTKIFRTSSGKWSVNGERVTFDFAPGKVQSRSDCDRQRNYTKTIDAEKQIFTYTVEPFNGGQKLCLLDADNANYCLYKK
jgi:hypothetical protein